MDPKVEKLFREKNLVFIATINLDGSPQLTPVWGDYQDGYILLNTAEGRIKHRNVLHDSRVAVCVVSHDNPLDMITIRGNVIEIIQDVKLQTIFFWTLFQPLLLNMQLIPFWPLRWCFLMSFMNIF